MAWAADACKAPETHHFAKGDKCDVGALPHDLGFSDRESKFFIECSIRHSKRLPIQQLVLQNAHWIWVPDCCLQTHALSTHTLLDYDGTVQRD
jgi:hypothetical protein